MSLDFKNYRKTVKPERPLIGDITTVYIIIITTTIITIVIIMKSYTKYKYEK